jgi:hypothetical protein
MLKEFIADYKRKQTDDEVNKTPCTKVIVDSDGELKEIKATS